MQTTLSEMVRSHPTSPIAESGSLIKCIRACAECNQTCTMCADACLAEDEPKLLARCIRLNLDCAAICSLTAGVVSRQLSPSAALVSSVLDACRVACKECAVECERHQAMHEHCRICAESCRRCERACAELAATIRPGSAKGTGAVAH